jgi:hypothetical protein
MTPAMPRHHKTVDVIEEMALALYDHFNPRPAVEIKVGKDACIRMAEVAFKSLPLPDVCPRCASGKQG